MSKIFNLPLLSNIQKDIPSFEADEIEKGGTGFAIQVENGREVFHNERHHDLPENIEKLYPDYSLFPEYQNAAYGFLTRGCCNNCSFCIVCAKEGMKSHRVNELTNFWRNQKEIVLLDPNLLACTERYSLLQELIDSKAYINFCQGLDARFITKDVAEMLSQINIKMLHFAFDFMKNEKAIITGLRTFRPYYTKSNRNLKCYVLTNYDTTNQEDWYRVKAIRDAGYYPYIMIYEKGTHNRFLTDLARWCNNLMLCNSVSFEDYVPRKDGKSCKELYPDILKKEIYFMSTTKAESVSTLNIYQKLAAMRNEFLITDKKKSGVNMHAEFTYFELDDIVPIAIPLCEKYKTLFTTSFYDNKAVGTLVNLENPSETIMFCFETKDIAEPAKFRMNEAQAVGACLTYYRRYLYMILLDIVDPDALDKNSGATPPKPTNSVPTKPAAKPEPKPEPPKETAKPIAIRSDAKKSLTDADGEADDVQKNSLLLAVKLLRAKDPSQEEFIRGIALRTNGFKTITKRQCEELINGINTMLDQYEGE